MYVVSMKQQKAVEILEVHLAADLTDWEGMTLPQRSTVFKYLREQGHSILKAMNTVLVVCALFMKELLINLEITPEDGSELKSSQFFAPLGTCLELECLGKENAAFKKLEEVQEKFLVMYRRRAIIIKSIRVLFQKDMIEHVYYNDKSLSRVRLGLCKPFHNVFY